MSAETTLRTPWQVMQATIIALSIRYIQQKFILGIQSRRAFGFILVFVEPLNHILIWMFLNHALSLDTLTHLPQPLFILIGASPFILTRNVIRESNKIIKKNKRLFNFRQVRPIDTIIAMILMEWAVNSVLFVLFLISLWWIGISWHCHHPGYLVIASIWYVLFLFGLSLIISIASFFLSFIESLVNMALRMIYMISGIFFTAQMLPDNLKPYFYANPLFHFIEILREGFSQLPAYTHDINNLYLFKAALISVLCGMGLYIALRHRMMVEIEQR